MNKPQFLTFTTIALALAGAATAAMAAEAEQWIPPTGALTRAEVKADLQRARAEQQPVVQLGEATVFVDGPAPQHVLATAAPSKSATQVIQLGEATVFVDAPGTRTREEVRAEAREAARSSRGDNTYHGS